MPRELTAMCWQRMRHQCNEQRTPCRRSQQTKYIGISSETCPLVERNGEDGRVRCKQAGGAKDTARPRTVTRPCQLRANVIRGAVKFADRAGQTGPFRADQPTYRVLYMERRARWISRPANPWRSQSPSPYHAADPLPGGPLPRRSTSDEEAWSLERRYLWFWDRNGQLSIPLFLSVRI